MAFIARRLIYTIIVIFLVSWIAFLLVHLIPGDPALAMLGEEAAEVVMACKDDNKDEIAGEVADLFYHSLVALAYHEVNLKDVFLKLQERRR